MYRRVIASLVIVVTVAACGSNGADAPLTTAPAGSSASTASGLDAAGGPTGSVTTVSPSPPDLTVFIAAVDTALADTGYAGAALTDPEVFIATGQLFCELLDEGATTDEVLSEHLVALAGNGEVTDDDAVASGVVLGVSTEIICPHHGP